MTLVAAVFDAFASADEATNPIEASDNASASNFFMIFPFPEIKPGLNHNVLITSGRRVALICQTLIHSKGLQAFSWTTIF